MSDVTYMKCYPKHLKYIDTGSFDAQELAAFLQPEAEELVFGHPDSRSAWVGTKPIAAFGLIPYYPGRRYIAWAILSKDIGVRLLDVTREIKRLLDAHPAPRVEMHVLSDFKEGHKWAKLLGFHCETPDGMKKHSYFGKDEHIYARVK